MSQSLTAAEPLSRVMEYETALVWRNSYGKISSSKGSIYGVCLGIYKHELFAPSKAEGLGCPPVTHNIKK